jgi:antirestriction protein
MKIYITNLKHYHAGHMDRGRWIILPMEEEDLRQELVDVIGGSDQRYIITDFLDVPTFLQDEFVSPYILNDVAYRAFMYSGMDREAYLGLANFIPRSELGRIFDYPDRYLIYPDCESMADVAEQYADMVGMFPEGDEYKPLKLYFDFEAFGRDLQYNGRFYQVSDSMFVEVIDI